ncbi:MAG: tRNA pseudouridine(55) synthase TruB [Bacteroidales bacterium]|nr:tRNA pseudouridine(55) synthase TruB [Bacteroidales bacterium]
MYQIIDKNTANREQPTLDEFNEGVVIPIDKPYSWTSADVVRKIKFSLQKYFKVKNVKVGHAGTLDPLAIGVLVVCIGKATKVAEQLQAGEKEYVATVKFGATTPSYDLEKEIDCEYPYEHITKESLEKVLESFVGEQDQVPPVFSAKMVGGLRAYEYARAGEEVELRSSRITISEIEMLSFDNDEDGKPLVKIRIRCSKGTYIRSLARDLGLAAGSGAHLTTLERTKSGEFVINNAFSLEELKLF